MPETVFCTPAKCDCLSLLSKVLCWMILLVYILSLAPSLSHLTLRIPWFPPHPLNTSKLLFPLSVTFCIIKLVLQSPWEDALDPVSSFSMDGTQSSLKVGDLNNLLCLIQFRECLRLLILPQHSLKVWTYIKVLFIIPSLQKVLIVSLIVLSSCQ